MKLKSLTAMSFGVALLLPGIVHAQKVMKLTAQDYIDIEQLSNRYPWAVDNCTNKGYDYADLYTDDGSFGVESDWGVPPTRMSTGRDALAKAAGGGPDGCRDPKTLMGYGISHIIIDQVITPTETGASGKAILLAIGVGGNPTTIERQGGYEDTYVKTAKGWRFKTRFHVFPNSAQSVQYKYLAAQRAAAAAAAPAAAPATEPAKTQ